MEVKRKEISLLWRPDLGPLCCTVHDSILVDILKDIIDRKKKKNSLSSRQREFEDCSTLNWSPT